MSDSGRARKLLTRPAAKAAGLSVLAVVAVTVLFWLHVFNQFGLDDGIERVFLKFASPLVGVTRSSEVVLIGIDEISTGELGSYRQNTVANAAWREYHAELVRKLTSAKARAVAFDLYFPAAGPDYRGATEEFADAIRTAQEAGKPRIVIGSTRGYATDEILAGAIGDADVGLVDIARTTANLYGKDYVGRVLLAEMTLTRTAAGDQRRLLRPLPMPLAIYLASQRAEKGTGRVTFEPSHRELRIDWERAAPTIIDVDVESCRTDDAGCATSGEPSFAGAAMVYRAVLPFWVRGASSFRTDPYVNMRDLDDLDADFSDRIVIVGAETGEEKVELGPGRPDDTIYGYQVLARVVTDLIHNRYPRRAGAGLQVAAFAVLVAIGLVARLRLPFREIDVSLPLLGQMRLRLGFFIVMAAFLFVAFRVFRSEQLLFDLAYDVIALVLGYFAVPALSGLLEKRTEVGS